jgi:hypothetical protein
MLPLNEEGREISEQFIERMVDKVIDRLGEMFAELDLSLKDIDVSVDFLGSLISDTDPTAMAGLQRGRHFVRSSRPEPAQPKKIEDA